MQFSISTGYGLLAVDYIAKNSDKKVTTQSIAQEYDISLEFLQEILNQLVNANILKTAQFPYDGFSLAKSTDKISMLEIIEAIEGPIFFEPYSNDFVHEEELAEIKETLEKTKLSDML